MEGEYLSTKAAFMRSYLRKLSRLEDCQKSSHTFPALGDRLSLTNQVKLSDAEAVKLVKAIEDNFEEFEKKYNRKSEKSPDVLTSGTLQSIRSLLYPHTAVELTPDEEILYMFTCVGGQVYLTSLACYVTFLSPEDEAIHEELRIGWDAILSTTIGVNKSMVSVLVKFERALIRKKSLRGTLQSQTAAKISYFVERMVKGGLMAGDVTLTPSSSNGECGGTEQSDLLLRFLSLHEAQWFCSTCRLLRQHSVLVSRDLERGRSTEMMIGMLSDAKLQIATLQQQILELQAAGGGR